MSSKSHRSRASRTGLETGSKRTGGYVQRNAAIVLMLPPPSQEWAWFDLPDRPDTPDPFPEAFLSKRSTLQENSVIEKVGTEHVEHDSGASGSRSLWRVKPRVWRFARRTRKQELQAEETFPCGHNDGFRTVDPEEGVYACGNEFCDETFDRETVERVMF